MPPQVEKDSIKAAVLGFGLAGRVFHAPFISAVPGLQLSSIMQRKGDEASKAYPDATILRSVDEVLASDAQLVVVGTPNETHFDLAMRCLEAGKHVVVDKPLAATSAEAATMAKLAAEKKLILAPFHNRRWDGDFLTVRALLLQGALGRLTTFESHFDRFRPIPRTGTWKEAAHPSNGMLFDLGPHLVDQVLCLFGVPQAITASVRTDRDNSEIEDAFDITLHYPRMLAICRATMIAADPGPRFHLHGTKGSFRKYGLDPQEPALVAGAKVPRLGSNGKPEPGDDWLGESSTRWGKIFIAPDPEKPTELTTYEVETELGDYRGFYLNVRDAIRGTGKLAVTPTDGYQVIRLLELARESSETGRTIPVVFEPLD
ncbi:Gfo/Idh/MocA family oxidoreductase [Granulicella aggregans]|uniref:Gfo/Idh/MocA family oxidoreductase n=1 Tax=Granulicella aggregans TaxID=474949 RepID=UPI0021DFC475|nr:Gfo/Idh/MocA family oxidoreductase [Granulicella aggregans]